jgi:hypothetical protein
MIDYISATYLEKLQWIYHRISNRGILVSTDRLKEAKSYVDVEIQKNLDVIKKIWGCHVYVGAANDDGTPTSVNLNSSSGTRTPLLKLKDMGYKIPKISVKDEDGSYIAKESLAELTLQKLFAINQFNHPGGDIGIKSLLKIRELATLKSRYINARLFERSGAYYYLSAYNVAGTTTGRRSSKKHIFGFGNNGQNFPSHGEEASIYKRCLISRPGTVFLMVDQMQAEDWPVNALAYNLDALKDLRLGVDRHRKLACAIFNLAWDRYTDEGWSKSIERYLGKKVRHAKNYGMRGPTMSDQLAAEGYSIPAGTCQDILDKASKVDPNVDEVFHKYVEQELYDKRLLQTPFRRERQFFGLRGGNTSGNQKVFRDAYSFIPQSTVGDNTGFAVNYLESKRADESVLECGNIVQEGHDSIIQEVADNPDNVWDVTQYTVDAFNRDIEFHNGIVINIPVEGKLGYDLDKTVTIKSAKTGSKRLVDCTYTDIQIALARLKEMTNDSRNITERQQAAAC